MDEDALEITPVDVLGRRISLMIGCRSSDRWGWWWYDRIEPFDFFFGTSTGMILAMKGMRDNEVGMVAQNDGLR